MQITTAVYDVALDGRVIASFEAHTDAQQFRAQHPGSQIRTRTETSTVPAVFAVFVDGSQVGESTDDPGEAAKTAKSLGGMIKMVAAVPA